MSEETNQGWVVIAGLLEEHEELRVALRPLLEETDSETIDSLLDEVDQSDYSMVDWAEAIVEFDQWLAKEKVIPRPLPEMLSYIHCCTLTNAPGIPLGSLKVIVYQSLTTFGFVAVSESQL